MATAFAALVSLQNNLRLIQNHPRHSFSFEDEQIESLWKSVCFLIKFMKSFNDSHGAIKEAAEALGRRIARAAQAAEDVIESHVVDQIRSGSTLGGEKGSRFLLDLQKAIDDMDFVRRKAVNVQKSQQPTFFAAAATTSSTSLTVGYAESNRMVGFDDELLRLLDLLTGVPSSRRVIPIVGMGGIGKTTLATNAFQHPYIVQYFDFCLWATISQDYSVHKILTLLLSSLLSHNKEKAYFLSKISTSVCSVDELGEELYKSLYGRRYLIILDDMWSVEAWDKMKFFFPDTSNGSRIAVTTRQSDVARHFGSLRLTVKFLDEKSSWDLFCSKTFGEEGCPHELEDIGKKIVGKCGGLPLAIVVVGGHLRKSSRTPESYLPPSISLLWNLQTLIITGAFRSIIAPYEIWEMLQLRHIAVYKIFLPDPLPIESLDQENDLVLRNLHRLSMVLNFRLSKEVCRRIPNIKTLALLYRDEPCSNYCLHNLGCFQELKSLQCYFVANAKCRDFALGLTFPSSLRHLNLRGSRLDWEDLTMMVGSLPYLKNLVLFKHSVIGSVWTPVEGGFPCLKELVNQDSYLIDWNAEASHFPVLEDVHFLELSKLDEFPPRIGEIPTLKRIILRDCRMSSTFSAMRMVMEQEEQGIEGPQLYVKFKGDEETLEGFKQKVEEQGLRSKNIHLKLKNLKTKGS